MPSTRLQTTAWLATRLNLSISTVERLRGQAPDDLPPHILIGSRTIRYDPEVVEKWLTARTRAIPSEGTAKDTGPTAPPENARRFFKKRHPAPAA